MRVEGLQECQNDSTASTLFVFNGELKLDINELILRKKIRGDCFRLLSACFYPPEKELYLQECLFQNLTTALRQVCPEAMVFSKKMEEAFLHYSGEDLAVEYARLFVGPYELKAPPYGSVYLDHERRVMGDSTMEVIKIYKEAGLSTDEDFKELPDHVAVELEFIYYLIHQEVEALENSEIDKALSLKETQEVFLNRFLKQWVPRFCAKMKEGTENEFYSALADCVLSFLSYLDGAKNFDLIIGLGKTSDQGV